VGFPSANARKVSGRASFRNQGEFQRHFKGRFRIRHLAVRILSGQPASAVSVGHFRAEEKWATFPPLSGAFVSLHGRKVGIAGPQTAILTPESPPAKFQYPNLFGGDSVRECGDWLGLSPFGSTCPLLWTLSGDERTSVRQRKTDANDPKRHARLRIVAAQDNASRRVFPHEARFLNFYRDHAMIGS
jgi:hypothetical protein